MRSKMPGWQRVLLAVGLGSFLIAFAASGRNALSSLDQAWPPFALVAGLLAIGFLANEDGLFRWTAAKLAKLPGGDRFLLVVSMLLVAAVTAIFNLDTAVVFLTPMLVHVARSRGADEAPFLYGAVMMSNSASLLLPGSNLTNLLILRHEHIAGAAFAARLAPAWAASVLVTTGVLLVWQHRLARAPSEIPAQPPMPAIAEGSIGALAATVLILTVRSPALPVLSLGIGLLVVRHARGALDRVAASRALDVTVIAGIFGIVLGFGTLSRIWLGPARVMATASTWTSTAIGVVGAVLINNLPAAIFLTARPVAHPRALLLGLNLGPNLAVTGSLSAVLWFRAARGVGARPSARAYSRVGLAIVPMAAAAALACLHSVR